MNAIELSHYVAFIRIKKGVIIILSYNVLEDKYKQLQKNNTKNKYTIIKQDKKITDLQDEIKLLKQLLNKRNKKLKEKNLIIGWLSDSDKTTQINNLKQEINTLNKQIEEKNLIIGWLLDR